MNQNGIKDFINHIVTLHNQELGAVGWFREKTSLEDEMKYRQGLKDIIHHYLTAISFIFGKDARSEIVAILRKDQMEHKDDTDYFYNRWGDDISCAPMVNQIVRVLNKYNHVQ